MSLIDAPAAARRYVLRRGADVENDGGEDLPKRECVRARVGYFRRAGGTARVYYCGTCFARLDPDATQAEMQCGECGATNVLPGR